MYRISIHDDAKDDLRQIQTIDAVSANRIAVILQQIKADPDLLDRLLEHDFGPEGGAPFNVQKYLTFWRKGLDVWRLKIWDDPKRLLPYRVIYAYDYGHNGNNFYVLGVVDRDFDYDGNHPTVKRIIATYRNLTS